MQFYLLVSMVFAVSGTMTYYLFKMAAIARNGKQVAVISGNKIAVCELGSDKKTIYTCEKKAGLKSQDSSEVDGAGSDKILACGYSSSGKYFAACDDWKQIYLWETGSTWTVKSVRALVRRAMTLRFARSEDKVIVGDKSGDVYSFSMTEPEEEGKLLMGHLSMLLDLSLAGKNDDLIVTCDRDEKIRVSHFPNSYNIQTFCLGHEEFVSSLCFFEELDSIVSGAGDGTVRVWDYRGGKERHVTDCYSLIGADRPTESRTEAPKEDSGKSNTEIEATRVVVKCLSCHQKRKILAASFDGRPDICIFRLKDDFTLESLQQLHLDGAEVSHMTLDDLGSVWTLTTDEKEAVQVYCWSEKDGKYEKVTEESSGEVFTAISALNSEPEFFKAAVGVESSLKYLHKPKELIVDHVKGYKQKKEERILGQKRKVGTEQENGKKTKESTA